MCLIHNVLERLMPGPIPTLGERMRNAVTRGESLEKHLSVTGEKVYETVDQAVEKMLQVNGPANRLKKIFNKF